MGKWYTFAPCPFETGPGFFRRDTGLLCRGLQALGHESKVILAGPAGRDEAPDVLRASLPELESPDWWRALKLDGIIMVAWARHRDTPIVRAIAASGTPLVMHIDGAAGAYPVLDQWDTLRSLWREERGTGRSWPVRCATFLKRAVTMAASLLLRYSYLKYRHLRYASVVSCQTPTAVERMGRFCSFFGGKAHGIRIELAGYPLPPDCRRDPAVAKEKRIVSIGRWEDVRQKRPDMLMAVCAAMARHHPDLQIDLFGTKTAALAGWHAGLAADLRARLHVHGVQPGEIVAAAIQRAQVSFFPSSSEGGPQALFEGLAAGATTVGFDSPDLPGARWAAACGHGTVAREDTVAAYVEALERELAQWARGAYSAEAIADHWRPWTEASQILGRMMAWAQDTRR